MAESDALHVAGAASAGATVSAVTAPPAMTSAAASLSAVWVINVTPRGSVGASTHQAAGVCYSRVGQDFVAVGIHIEGPAQPHATSRSPSASVPPFASQGQFRHVVSQVSARWVQAACSPPASATASSKPPPRPTLATERRTPLGQPD